MKNIYKIVILSLLSLGSLATYGDMRRKDTNLVRSKYFNFQYKDIDTSYNATIDSLIIIREWLYMIAHDANNVSEINQYAKELEKLSMRSIPIMDSKGNTNGYSIPLVSEIGYVTLYRMGQAGKRNLALSELSKWNKEVLILGQKVHKLREKSKIIEPLRF